MTRRRPDVDPDDWSVAIARAVRRLLIVEEIATGMLSALKRYPRESA